MRSHVNTALWDAETRKEHTEWLLPFFDSIAAYFFKKTPQLHPVSGRFWVSGNSTSHPFLKADATTSYYIVFGNENEGKEATDICYKPST